MCRESRTGAHLSRTDVNDLLASFQRWADEFNLVSGALRLASPVSKISAALVRPPATKVASA